MTAKELTERCRNRCFDQIVVVTDDIFSKMANMQKVQKDIPGCICTFRGTLIKADGRKGEYAEKRAVYYYANTSICFVEPVEGDTLYSRFLKERGEGLCCIREKVSHEELAAVKQRFSDFGFEPAQCEECGDSGSYWFDLTSKLGILYEISDGKEADLEVPVRSDVRIAQINISTPSVQDTISFITDLLEIGPWEVGCQANACSHDTAFSIDGELKDQEFAFLLAILVCGNIEWEVIEPVKGKLVYSEFIERRGIGFHHILQEIPQGQWKERLDTYANDGISINCKGSLGPVDWCYMDTEKELGFYVELRTDAVMDALPDGYIQYYYPED